MATAVYLNPMAARREAFAAACGPLFARLELAGSAAACTDLLGRGQPDLLVIDLEGVERGADAAVDADALVALAAGRAAPTLLLCPGTDAGWLLPLLGGAATAYAITPLDPAQLRERVARALADSGAREDAQAEVNTLRCLLRLRARAQATLDGAADLPTFAQRLCDALCDGLAGWPGLLHAAVLHVQAGGEVRLEAQGGKPDLRVDELPGGASSLQRAPLRHAFPGLAAAAGGRTVLVETPEQVGDPALARALRAHGVAMAAGIPIPSDGPGPARGALSLLFDATRSLGVDELALLEDLARLAAAGMRQLETVAENEALLARLTQATTLDALTGVANRRHGEDVLEREIRRARRYRQPLALVAFDIDRFRAVNETYGFPVGDVALRTVADVVRAALRASDVLVRSGGEEFHVIAPHTSAIEAFRMAEKIRVAVEQAPVPGCDHLTVSLGVAQLGDQESGDSLAQRVAAALARAKRAGRNCVELAMQ